MKAKLQAILAQLNAGLVEREQVLKTTLLAVLAGENPVLIGPPGTGKSLMARRMAEALAQDSSDYFEYLLTKFSTPEEIFGPLSISELKADRFKRNTAGYLPTVKLAFLDEIFKASSSILNALLTILNERIYHNGAQPQRVPLQALIAASNELPNDQEELSALYDRFLVRVFVDYVSDAGLPRLFETTTEPQWSAETQLQGHELQRIREGAHAVQLPPEIAQAMQRIWALHRETFKEDRRESLSDRRLKKIIYLLRVSAATNGRREVDLSDVLLLKDCLWNHPDNAVKVRELVLKTLRGFSRLVPVDTSESQTKIEPITTAATPVGRLGALIKGFKGSGTKHDPLLIETVEHLADLANPEIGQQGYCFRQTSDLDCGDIRNWPTICFIGNYDGGGYEIRKLNNPFLDGYFSLFHKDLKDLKELSIFSTISKSTVFDLKLKNFCLANIAENNSIIDSCDTNLHLIIQIEGSYIYSCNTAISLVKLRAENCEIKYCKSHRYIIDGDSIKCIITCCSVENGSLINGSLVEDTIISDCFIIFKPHERGFFSSLAGAGIAKELSKKSIIRRCFISDPESKFNFNGITEICDSDCTIQNNALGISRGKREKSGRIAYNAKNGAIIKDNISIDVNLCASDAFSSNTNNGESVAELLFTQRYFENKMGWDFENIWYWHEQNNRPELRSAGLSSVKITSTTSSQNIPEDQLTVDLLTRQIRANIWL